ncbi:MAG: GEVED domain-containing protein, partial [Bacteroidales bacterium]|nr:GEVED domain-containing protein [Bacteroidales bacterium]
MRLCVIKACTLMLFALGLLCNNANAQNGQCLSSGGCSGGTKYPSAEQSTTTDTWTIVSTIIYAGEYAVYNVSLGETYEWSLLTIDGGSSSYDSQLTLLSEDGTTQYCFSDDVQNLNAKITWTATFTGKVRVLVNQYLSGHCKTNTISTTLVWRCASCGSITPPVNDDCAGAVSLTVFTETCGGATTGTVLGATNSGYSSCVGTANNDVWYKFVATSAPFHDITVIGSSDFDAVLDLRTGPSCPGTNLICIDNNGRGGTEILSANNLVSGQTYYVRVYDYYSSLPSTTNFTICITSSSTCEPSYSYGTSSGDFVDGVELTGENSHSISNTSTGASASPYIVDYSSTHSADLKAGFSYALKLTNGTYSGQTLAAWIDYNNDGIYSATEKLGEFSNIDGNQSVIINFTVPAGASIGTTKMLVRSVWSDTNIDPCETYSFGEAEIYGIKIIDPCVTPAAPVSLLASSITASTATVSWSAGNPAGSPTITYYWAIGAASNTTYESNYIQRGSGTTLSANLTNLVGGTQYYYTVKAVTNCNNTASNYASASNFTTLCVTPGTLTNLTTTSIGASSAQLNWTASTTVGSPTVQYYWAINTSSTVNYETNYVQRGITSNLNVLVYNLSLGTQYYWTVKAVTSCGSGSASSYATAINFTTLAIDAPLTWTGNTSTDWNTATNWNPQNVPTATNNVIIPADRPRYPIITSSGLSINNSTYTFKCKSLTIDNGGNVSITGTGLYVSCSGDMNLAGTLNYSVGAYTNRFNILSGGNVVVNQSGIMNIGNMGLTADRYNGIELNSGGVLSIYGGTVTIMNTLKHEGTLNITEGHLYLKHYGGGGNNIPWDAYASSFTNISGGTVHISGVEAKSSMIDWNASQTMNITGGDISIELKKHTSGTDNN